MDGYSIIKGKQFVHAQYRTFTEERWIQLFRFFEMFLVPKGETEEIKVNQVKLDELSEDETYKEFYVRVSMDDDYKSTTKVNSLCLNALAFLKKNPSMVTEEMKSFITIRHPKAWGWCLKQYDTAQTVAGEIVVRDENTPQPVTNPTLPSIQAKMMGSLIKIADIYEKLAGSVSDHDYRQLSAVEKFKALKDLSFIFTAASKKVTPSSFTQVNINTMGVKDAEAALLKYVTKE